MMLIITVELKLSKQSQYGNGSFHKCEFDDDDHGDAYDDEDDIDEG